MSCYEMQSTLEVDSNRDVGWLIVGESDADARKHVLGDIKKELFAELEHHILLRRQVDFEFPPADGKCFVRMVQMWMA